VKIRKLYIEKQVWRRQDKQCDAVTSPLKLSSDYLDPLLTPSRHIYFQAITTLLLLTPFLRDAVKSVLGRHGNSWDLLLTPSRFCSWRHHLLFPAWKIKTLAFSDSGLNDPLKVVHFSPHQLIIIIVIMLYFFILDQCLNNMESKTVLELIEDGVHEFYQVVSEQGALDLGIYKVFRRKEEKFVTGIIFVTFLQGCFQTAISPSLTVGSDWNFCGDS
jgi:hypothetical protein